jgi:glycerol-3-phosphate O-acyltransferase
MDSNQFGSFEGTSISQLKEPVRMTETEIDYDKIMNNLNLSENKMGSEMKPKKASNMNHFVKNLENDLDNFGSRNVQYGEPMPANLTKEMMQTIQNEQKDKVISQIPQTIQVTYKGEPIPE